MGLGALLIPGGNDTLLMIGFPMGAWQAALAYPALCRLGSIGGRPHNLALAVAIRNGPAAGGQVRRPLLCGDRWRPAGEYAKVLDLAFRSRW